MRPPTERRFHVIFYGCVNMYRPKASLVRTRRFSIVDGRLLSSHSFSVQYLIQADNKSERRL